MFYLINLLNVKVSNETTKLYIDLSFIKILQICSRVRRNCIIILLSIHNPSFLLVILHPRGEDTIEM